MINDKIYTRKHKKEERQRNRHLRQVSWISAGIVVLFIIVAVLYFIMAKPFVVKSVSFESKSPKFESDISPYFENVIGTNAFKNIFKNNSIKDISNIIRGRYTYLERELSSGLPEYKNINVKYSFGGKLVVSGDERSAFISFVDDAEAVITDRDGFVVAITDADNLIGENADNVPTVRNIGLSAYNLGNKLLYTANVPWKTIVEIYFTVFADDALCRHVKSITYAGDRIYLSCIDGVTVDFGGFDVQETYFNKLERLSAILSSESPFIKDGTIVLADNAVDSFRPNGDPNATEIPEETDAEPTETIAPTDTPKPKETAVPTPELTATPEPTEAVTETPEETEVPTPEPTEEPTEIPEVTEEPEATEITGTEEIAETEAPQSEETT